MSAIHQLEVPMAPVTPARRHLRALPDAPASAPRRSPRVRMARRRFTVLLVLAVVAGGAFLAGKAFASDASAGSSAVTVQQGDTLSGVASRVYPRIPVGQAVALLQQANNLSSVHVDAGEKLVVPQR